MTVEDDIIECETLEEAIGVALANAPPGCVITIHAADCEPDDEDEDSCTCSPVEIVAGATA